MTLITTFYYDCDCGAEVHESDLDEKCIFHGSLEEPAEYDYACPECHTNWENMEERVEYREVPDRGPMLRIVPGYDGEPDIEVIS